MRSHIPYRFVPMPVNVLEHKNLHPAAKLVMAALALRAMDDESVEFFVQDLANQITLSHRAVQYGLKELRSAGIIRRDDHAKRGPGCPEKYILVDTGAKIASLDQKGCKIPQEGVQNHAEMGAKTASTNREEEREKRETGAGLPGAPAPVEDTKNRPRKASWVLIERLGRKLTGSFKPLNGSAPMVNALGLWVEDGYMTPDYADGLCTDARLKHRTDERKAAIELYKRLEAEGVQDLPTEVPA